MPTERPHPCKFEHILWHTPHYFTEVIQLYGRQYIYSIYNMYKKGNRNLKCSSTLNISFTEIILNFI